MFSRRRGSSAARRPLDSSTSSNAAVAASQAFLKKSNSNASLSSAAAAAALRSVTSSPEPVGSIVTKRMIRRGSVSSVGSGSVMGGSSRGGTGRPALQRQNSSGSMTERTFRSPSPGRHNGPVPASYDAPPVPAIPARMPSGHKRSSSVEPPPRMTSPTPRRGGRNMSVDRANIPPPLSTGSGKRLSNVGEELQRTDSNTSVNFSRPRSSQPSSPIGPSMSAKQFTHGMGAWHTEPTGVAARSTETSTTNGGKLARIQAAALQAMNRSTSSTRPSLATNASYEGPPTLSYESDNSVMVYDPNTRSFVSKPRLKPKQPETKSAVLPALPLPAPGTYDPHTRKIVPPSPVTTPRSEKSQPQFPVVDTRLQPPPRNPARISPTEATTTALPSPVHKGSITEEKVGILPALPVYVTPTVTGTPIRSDVEPKSLRPAAEISPRGRHLSSSPSPHRAHFSHSPIIDAQKHSPPDRDLSPVKSALKHSPANSLRASSPLIFASNVKSPPSEVSDYSDVGSQDGLGVKKKKKSVRVSFEEQPVAIEPIPIVARAPLQDNDDDDEEIMTPRPALPSFGSVRRSNRIDAEVAEKVTEMTPTRHAASNDHAIGGILKNASDPITPEAATKESLGDISDESEELATNIPAQNLEALGTEQNSENVESRVKEITHSSVSDPETEEHGVPAINLLPPTPGTEEESKALGGSTGDVKPVGSIPVDSDLTEEDANQAELVSAAAAAATVLSATADAHDGFTSFVTPGMLEAINEDSDDAGEFSDAAEDLSELENGGFVSMDAVAVSPVNNTKAPAKTPIARVSPPESPLAKQMAKKPERVEAVDEQDKRSTGDWSEATAYWKRLSRQQREQIERDHFSSDDEGQPVAVRKSKKINKQTPVANANVPVAAITSPQTSAPQQVSKRVPTSTPPQPAKPSLKKSLRDQPQVAPAPADGEVHMRRSMRDGGSAMTASLRNGTTQRPRSTMATTQAPAMKQTMRPASSAPPVASSQRQDSAYPRIESPKTSQPVPMVSRRLQKELQQNDDSDSESSFKKKRRSQSKDTGGRFSMRRSMRGASVDRGSINEERPTSPTPAKGKRSLSIRSLSPTGSFLGRNRGEKLRESLRGNNDSATRLTLRGPQSLRNEGKSRFGNSTRSSNTQAPSSSRFKSRFADSDDEDDRGQNRGGFRSRFADSDDEDNTADLTPVRGIPRPRGYDDGDSTDLEDEDDIVDARKTSRKREKMSKPMVPDPADVDKAMEAARKKLGMTNGNANGSTSVMTNGIANGTTAPAKSPVENKEGSVLMRGSLRDRSDSDRMMTKPPPEESVAGSVYGDTPTKRRGFMSGILRRNRASSSASIPTINHGRTSAIPPLSIPGNNTATGSGQESERITSPPPLRSSMPAKLIRGDSNYSNATAPPMFGDRGEHWPLPPPVPHLPDGVLRNGSIRPMSSDNVPNKGRKASSVRFEEGVIDNNVMYSHRTGKKKKFGIIRRAFGLND